MDKNFTWLIGGPELVLTTAMPVEQAISKFNSCLKKQPFFSPVKTSPSGHKNIVGEIRGDSFSLHYINTGKGRQPLFNGTIRSLNGKTIIRGRFLLHPSTLFGSIFAFVFILFISLIFMLEFMSDGGYGFFLATIILLTGVITAAFKTTVISSSDELNYIKYFEIHLNAELIEKIE